MATNGILNGTLFGVYEGSTLVAYATSGSITINHNLRDTSTKESGGWKDQLEGQRDWEVSCDGMVAFLTSPSGGAVSGKTVDEMFTSYIATRTTLTVSFESSETGDYKWSGSSFLTSISMDAPNEESATYSMSFSGTGALTQASV